MKLLKKCFFMLAILWGVVFSGFATNNPREGHYECPSVIVDYLNSLKIKNENYSSVGRHLPFSGGAENLRQSEVATPEQAKALRVFYDETRQIFEKMPPSLQSGQPNLIEIDSELYRQLLNNQMNAIRVLCDYIEYDIVRRDKAAAIEHFVLIVRLAGVSLGAGEKLIYWRILSNVTLVTERLIHHFTFTDREFALLSGELNSLLGMKEKRLMQLNEDGLMQQIGGKVFKGQRGKDAFFSSQQRAISRAECAFLGICAMQYRQETRQWPSEVRDLVPRFLRQSDCAKFNGVKMKAIDSCFEIYIDASDKNSYFVIEEIGTKK